VTRLDESVLPREIHKIQSRCSLRESGRLANQEIRALAIKKHSITFTIHIKESSERHTVILS
jgi:hypothetical protein